MQILNISGAKARIADWIVSHFPPHEIYVEPFGGSGAVLIAKPQSKLEVFNDLNGGLVHFFQVLAAEPDALIKRIDGLLYSPFRDTRPTTDPVELATRFFLHNNTTWPAANSNMFRRQKYPDKNSWRSLAVIFQQRKTFLAKTAERIRHVLFEHDDALKVIKRYDGPGVLFYVDPPYYGKRRANLYRHEMMDAAAHRELASVLKEARGNVVVSGYSSELYQELYGNWTASRSGFSDGGDLRQECLWIKGQVSVSAERSKNRPPIFNPCNGKLKKGRHIKALLTDQARNDVVQADENERLKTHTNSTRFRDESPTSRSRLLRTLARRAPEILERYERGEFDSVHAAAIAAGIIKIKTPLEQLDFWWAKASQEDQRAFIENHMTKAVPSTQRTSR